MSLVATLTAVALLVPCPAVSTPPESTAGAPSPTPASPETETASPPSSVRFSSDCPTCEAEYCPKTGKECSHGLVPDKCGCCPEGVCLLFERERCLDLKLYRNMSETHLTKMGVCEEYSECRLRTDVKAGEIEESVCQCQKEEICCGNDKITYRSMCQLKEAGTELNHTGACWSAPEFVSVPEVSSTLENEQFSLECQAKGFPVPDIRWEFEGLNGVFRSLPGDDHSIAVHNRGGPDPLTVSSWVMIEALRSSDSGTYICVAKNSEGLARTLASVHVTSTRSP